MSWRPASRRAGLSRGPDRGAARLAAGTLGRARGRPPAGRRCGGRLLAARRLPRTPVAPRAWRGPAGAHSPGDDLGARRVAGAAGPAGRPRPAALAAPRQRPPARRQLLIAVRLRRPAAVPRVLWRQACDRPRRPHARRVSEQQSGHRERPLDVPTERGTTDRALDNRPGAGQPTGALVPQPPGTAEVMTSRTGQPDGHRGQRTPPGSRSLPHPPPQTTRDWPSRDCGSGHRRRRGHAGHQRTAATATRGRRTPQAFRSSLRSPAGTSAASSP